MVDDPQLRPRTPANSTARAKLLKRDLSRCPHPKSARLHRDGVRDRPLPFRARVDTIAETNRTVDADLTLLPIARPTEASIACRFSRTLPCASRAASLPSLPFARSLPAQHRKNA